MAFLSFSITDNMLFNPSPLLRAYNIIKGLSFGSLYGGDFGGLCDSN